ncbi:MAG: glycosyltransferase family 87 protein [Halobaculum sp.]
MSALRSLWRERRDRPVFVAAVCLLLAVLLAWPVVDHVLRGAGLAPQFRFWDFGAYRSATARWLRGESIYVRNEQGGFHGKYLYPPLVLVGFLPLSGLTFHAAGLVWAVGGLVVLWGGVQLALDALGVRLAALERVGLFWLLAGFQPVLLTVKMGQTATYLAGLLCVALAVTLTGDHAGRVTGGAITALVAAIKLPYAPVGAHLLRERRRLAGAVALGATFVGASVAVFGIEPNREFLAVLRWGIESGSSSRSPRLWLPPYFRPFHGVPRPTGVRLLIAGCVALAAAASGPRMDREAFAVGAAAVPLLAPQTYAYYLTACLPAVLALTAAELDRDGSPAIPVVAGTLAAVHSHGLHLLVTLVPPLPPLARPLIVLLQPGLWAVWLLVGLATARLVGSVDLAVVSETADPRRR